MLWQVRRGFMGYSHQHHGVPVAGGSLLNGSESDGTSLLSSPNIAMTSGWNVDQATLTNAQTTAPDGNNTGSSLIENSATNRHIAYQQLSGRNTNVTRHVSVYAKQGTRRYLQIYFQTSASNAAYAYFDLQTGAVTDSGLLASATSISNVTITAAVSGFYKCEFDCILGGGTGDNPYMLLVLADRATQAGGSVTGGVASYAGNGSSLLYLWRPKVT